MKRIVALLLVLFLFAPVAFAEISLEGLTYAELVALKDRINLAIWKSDEWQEITVPQGVWKVGEDIPAGIWTVKCAESWLYAFVCWGEYLTENGERISGKGRNSYRGVYNPNHKYYSEGDGAIEYTFEVYAGEYIVIIDGSVVFTPYAGKPSLGFK